MSVATVNIFGMLGGRKDHGQSNFFVPKEYYTKCIFLYSLTLSLLVLVYNGIFSLLLSML